jgi:hypothetical protein
MDPASKRESTIFNSEMLHEHHLYQKAQPGETEAVPLVFLPKPKITKVLLQSTPSKHTTQSQQGKKGNGDGLR